MGTNTKYNKLKKVYGMDYKNYAVSDGHVSQERWDEIFSHNEMAKYKCTVCGCDFDHKSDNRVHCPECGAIV